jgi:hypothetical protein
VVEEFVIAIHKSNFRNYPNTKEILLELKASSGLPQSYSGVYDFETFTNIIDKYKLVRIVVYCDGMHASTIVKIIFTLQQRKYRLRIHRVVVNYDISNTLRTIILRFWLPLQE